MGFSGTNQKAPKPKTPIHLDLYIIRHHQTPNINPDSCLNSANPTKSNIRVKQLASKVKQLAHQKGEGPTAPPKKFDYGSAPSIYLHDPLLRTCRRITRHGVPFEPHRAPPLVRRSRNRRPYIPWADSDFAYAQCRSQLNKLFGTTDTSAVPTLR